MDTIRKLIITLVAMLLISLGFNSVAYAGELTVLENTDNNDAINNSDTKDNADITDDGDTTSEGYLLNDGDTTSEGYLFNEGDTTNEGYLLDEGDITDDTILSYTEGLYDSEAYEIFIDEQGQVYYLERESVEPEETEKENKNETVKRKKKPSYTESDLRLLSCLVYTEAGNQSYDGMLAVANVVLNRVKSEAYYHVNSVKEVIYDKLWAVQFSVTKKDSKTGKSALDMALDAYDTGEFSVSNPEAEKKAMNKAIKAAKAALNGENNINNYLCFRMNNRGAESIKKKYSKYRILGDHIFYRTK